MLNFFKRVLVRRPLEASQPQPTLPAEENESGQPSLSEVLTETATATQRTVPQPNGTLELDFRPIAEQLPPSLKSSLLKHPGNGVKLRLSLARITPQLAAGRVQVSFAEIKAGVPPGFFPGGSAHDPETVVLPLRTVLSRLRPELLHRKKTQKRVEVPSDVGPLFGTDGELLTPLPPEAPGRNGSPAPAEAQRGSSPSLAPSTRRVKPEEPAVQETPVVIPGPKVEKDSSPALPLCEPPPRVQVLPLAAPIPMAQAGPRETAPVVSKAQPAPDAGGGTLIVPLSLFLETLPGRFRTGLMSVDAERIQVHLPALQIEKKLRQGKLVFEWRQLRSWLRPSPGLLLPAHDSEEIELPLPVIAPLYFARNGGSSERKKLRIEESIPDLFAANANGTESQERNGEDTPAASRPQPSDEPKAATGPVTAPASIVPGPQPLRLVPSAQATPPSADAPVKAGPAASAQQRLDPGNWVEACCRTAGVSGAIAATADGLLISGRGPAGVHPERVAGFLPQTFTRVAQFAEVANLSKAGLIRLAAGRSPCLLGRSGNVFVMVLGQENAPLPEDTISALTDRLIS